MKIKLLNKPGRLLIAQEHLPFSHYRARVQCQRQVENVSTLMRMMSFHRFVNTYVALNFPFALCLTDIF